MALVVTTFPFSPEAVEEAQEFRDLLAALVDDLGEDITAWGREFESVDFRAALASHWALLSGREPGNSADDLLRQVLVVTDEQFTARVQRGIDPFA